MHKTQQQQVQQAPDKAVPPSTQDVHQPHPDKHSGPMRVARAANTQADLDTGSRGRTIAHMQQSVGNARATHMTAEHTKDHQPAIQRQPATNPPTVATAATPPVDWKTAYAQADKAAKTPKMGKAAQDQYKDLIVRAAQSIIAPAPLVDKKPTTGDIQFTMTKTGVYDAFVDPKKVDNAPDDYWKWVFFNPSSVHDDEAFTVSLIAHELNHAAHVKALFDAWKQAGNKKGWDEFYLDHFQKWTEKPLNVVKSGMVGALSGLPDKIEPSAIEFRAYTSQFVQFFHKVLTDQQSFFSRGVILFYPLKIQEVKAKISDPALDLASARQQILDYFNTPPVKDKSRQKIIRDRVASELKSALVLFRPPEDHARIKTDFKAIFDYPLSPEDRTDARKNYQPEAL